MVFEVKDTTKYIRGRKKTVAVIKDNNLIPKNPTGRRGKRNPNRNSMDGDSKNPFGEFNYDKTQQRRRWGFRETVSNSFDWKHSCFVTLTFDGERLGKEKVTDLDWAHKEFRRFIKRVNYRYDKFVYIATFARQNNGNWHYHMICNFPPETTKKEIKEMWGNGRVDKTLFESEGHLENVIKYLIKNMKDITGELKGRKGYLSSFSAKRNIRVCSWKEEDSEKYAELSRIIVERGKDSTELLYKGEKPTGVIKEETDVNTGKKHNDIIAGVELDEELKKQGYRELVTRTEVYLSHGSNEDVFPAPQFAVLKPQKKKGKRKGKAKKKK